MFHSYLKEAKSLVKTLKAAELMGTGIGPDAFVKFEKLGIQLNEIMVDGNLELRAAITKLDQKIIELEAQLKKKKFSIKGLLFSWEIWLLVGAIGSAFYYFLPKLEFYYSKLAEVEFKRKEQLIFGDIAQIPFTANDHVSFYKLAPASVDLEELPWKNMGYWRFNFNPKRAGLNLYKAQFANEEHVAGDVHTLSIVKVAPPMIRQVILRSYFDEVDNKSSNEESVYYVGSPGCRTWKHYIYIDLVNFNYTALSTAFKRKMRNMLTFNKAIISIGGQEKIYPLTEKFPFRLKIKVDSLKTIGEIPLSIQLVSDNLKTEKWERTITGVADCQH